MEKFKNITYPFQTPDDVFVARGYNLNQIVDEINSWSIGTAIDPIAFGGTTDITLGNVTDIDSAKIDYKATFPDSSAIGAQIDEVGELVINNSMNHANKTALSWTRECTNHGQGSLTIVGIEIVVVGLLLVMRITNGSSYEMDFSYTFKPLNHAR